MEVARPIFRTPQPHHLAELRIEAAQSAVAFSAPCAAGRKRRCLLPAFSPRKKMLLELPPFSSAPAPARSPPSSTGCTARVFSSGLSPTGGSGVGGSFAFFASPEQPLTPTGSNGRGAFAFLASPERPLTPMGSTASGGFGVLAPQPSLSPSPRGSSGTGASEFLASLKPARTGSNGSGGFAFFASPEPQHTGSTGIGAFPLLASPKAKTAVRRTGSPVSAATKELAHAGSGFSGGGGLVSPPFVFSTSRTSASPVRKSGRSNLWSRRRRSQRQSDEQLRIILPPRKVAKTEALATGQSSRCAAPSVLTAKPCCTFLTSPAKASKQEAKKDTLAASDAPRSSSLYRSPAGTCCTFVTLPTRPSSVEKTSKREREVQVSSVAGEGRTSLAACSGAEVVVRVTCSCGARKEFCFDHCH